MTAYATKTSLTKVLRAKGQDIPSIRDVEFGRLIIRRCYVLRWMDRRELWHWADYTFYDGKPVLTVDDDAIPITTEEAESYGLIRQ